MRRLEKLGICVTFGREADGGLRGETFVAGGLASLLLSVGKDEEDGRGRAVTATRLATTRESSRYNEE